MRRWWAALVVTALGLWLVWPLPLGVMPLSADHTVHLARAYLVGQNLLGGHITGWSSTWFYGFPAGELYPVLGDLLVCLLRALSFGLASWAACYALVVTFVFVLQGWVLLHAGRLLGMGPLPGLFAAAWMLLDAGAYREGGFTYTITYGVWPQALATSLAILGFVTLIRALRGRETPGGLQARATTTDTAPTGSLRHLTRAAWLLGAALLAHPMTLLMSVVGAGLLGLTFGLRGGGSRVRVLQATLVQTGLAVGLGVGVAAWWLLPMLAHRGWMVSYGWLYQSLEVMAEMVRTHGAWTHAMPAYLGYTIIAGMVLAAVMGTRYVRWIALWALCHWLFASIDVFWQLRLDWLSEGFTHLQYQRFLIATKPAFFLLAGWVVTLPWHWLRRARSQLDRRAKWPVVGLLAGLGVAAAATVSAQAWTVGQEHGVGQVQLTRLPGRPSLDHDYPQFSVWLKEQVDQELAAGRPPIRIAVRAHRNLHWFMDLPAKTGARVYKLGFTPGSNFVHKPEVGHEELYRQLGVRYLVTTGARAGSRVSLVAEFGRIRVWERRDWEADLVAHIQGPGELRVIDGDPDDGAMAFEVVPGPQQNPHTTVIPAAPDQTWLIVHVAGYPRWEMLQNGQPIPWVEVPARVGRGGRPTVATQLARRQGAFRGGKAHGDDGSEPILMAAPVGPGTVELRYHRWRTVDILGACLSLMCGGLLVGTALRPQRAKDVYTSILAIARRVLHPALLLAVIAVVGLWGGQRWLRGHANEAGLASSQPASQSTGFVVAPLKTDMMIVPALVVDPEFARRGEAAVATIPVADVPAKVTGWLAIDDDQAKQHRRRNYQFVLEWCPGEACGPEDWHALVKHRVRHRPGRVWFSPSIPGPSHGPGTLRATITTDGPGAPQMGFNLDLTGATWPGQGGQR